MDEKVFLEKMTNLLDTEEDVTMASVLADIEEWDSLSFVSFLAMASSLCGKKIEPKAVRSAEKVKDLYALLQG